MSNYARYDLGMYSKAKQAHTDMSKEEIESRLQELDKIPSLTTEQQKKFDELEEKLLEL